MTQEIQTKEILTSPGDADEDYQKHILQYVSRTFALTIPQLPADLGRVVSNAYLLCRIADTIEDDNSVDSEQTRRLAEVFVQVVDGDAGLDLAAPRRGGTCRSATRRRAGSTA